MTSRNTVKNVLLALHVVGVCAAQSPGALTSPARGAQFFAGGDDAMRCLEQRGFVVVSNGVVAETGKRLKQLFEVYLDLDPEAPQVITADAVADAKLRAQQYAAAAGLTLGPIQSLSEGGGVEPPRPMYRMMAMAATPTPIAAGEESVSASVTIVWEIR